MSYELRTPLTSISGFAEMLHAGFAGDLTTDGKGYVGAILDSAERLGLLIDDVLDLTSTAGSDTLEKSDIDVGTLARAAADAQAPPAKRHGITMAIEIQRSAGRLTADARRIREVMEHLLRHAIASAAAAATPDGEPRQGGRVLLHVDGNARIARITVSDDGQGMDAEMRARAFDRFAETTIAPGTDRALGLGLPLAKQFVEAHGGTIRLQSERGQGNVVTVELPRR
ncbi:sensor histidine kinase [Sphingomonas sp. MMS24-JH45]